MAPDSARIPCMQAPIDCMHENVGEIAHCSCKEAVADSNSPSPCTQVTPKILRDATSKVITPSKRPSLPSILQLTFSSDPWTLHCPDEPLQSIVERAAFGLLLPLGQILGCPVVSRFLCGNIVCLYCPDLNTQSYSSQITVHL